MSSSPFLDGVGVGGAEAQDRVGNVPGRDKVDPDIAIVILGAKVGRHAGADDAPHESEEEVAALVGRRAVVQAHRGTQEARSPAQRHVARRRQ